MADHNRPWFPFYARDWLSDEKVRTLSFEARGVYIELLCLLWKSSTCTLPNDLKRLARMVGIEETRFAKIWSDELMNDFAKLFITRRGKIWSKRLLNIHRFVKSQSERNRNAARARWDKGSHANASLAHMQNDAKAEAEADADTYKEKKAESASRHFEQKFPQYVDTIKTVAGQIDVNGFLPFQFVQHCVNEHKHPEAIVLALKRIAKEGARVKKPWAYAEKIVKRESGNFHERDHVSESAHFAANWNLNPEVRKLVKNIF